MNFPALPSFYEDPYFQKSQGQLYGVGTDFLAGKIPDYYKSIGEAGGPEFQDLLRLNTADITRASLESAAKTGTRGGAVSSNIAKAVGDMTTRLRWADLTRSMAGKEKFLDTGINALTGVRNAGLQFGGQKNSFNLGIAGIEQNQAKYMMEQENAKKASKDSLWSSIISGALGTAGTVAGAFFGGPTGAAAGYSLGSSAAKSITGGGGGASSIYSGTSGDAYGVSNSLDQYGGLDYMNLFGGR